MGQLINVEHEVVADSVVFSADRSITGQSGWAFSAGEQMPDEAGFAGALATRLFESDEAIDHVWVASNTVVVRRKDGWSDGSVEAASAVLSNFFVYYRQT